MIFLGMSVTPMLATFTMMFMSFGIYNPGWRCLDVDNNTQSNSTPTNPSAKEYTEGGCHVFDSCTHVEFNTHTVTIVSEWGLVCHQAWISSIILSIQMAGLLIGCIVCGHLGDAFGRKTVIYTSQGLLVVLNIISIFSVSWQMFATLRFFIGVVMSSIVTLYYVYVVEFVTKKWRAPFANIPFWGTNCILFALVCMGLKNWRHVHIATAIVGVMGLVPAIWVPESLRWLEVRNKKERFENAARKIARINKKELPSCDDLEIELKQGFENCENDKLEYYSLRHIFKKQYRMKTFLLCVPWFSVSLIFYAIGFGVKALNGNIYVNMIIFYTIEYPFTPLAMIVPNALGRKRAAMLLVGISGMCLLVAACLQRLTEGIAQTVGIMVLVSIGRTLMGDFWGVLMTYTTEIYPTVIRSLGTSWGNSVARVSGIIAPFLIPNEPSAFFVCYIVMGLLAVLCCVIFIFFPETKGKPLQETFDEDNNNGQGAEELDKPEEAI